MEEAIEHLRLMGQRGHEGFALWLGRKERDSLIVTKTLVPLQEGIRTGGGVCVTISGDELFRINRYLYESQLSLFAQIHSHPGEAYHSDTDDAYAVVTTLGGLSLVVPDFARRPFALVDCAVYRLVGQQAWAELTAAEVQRLIHILDEHQ